MVNKNNQLDYALLSTAEWVTLVPRSNVAIHTAASSSTINKPLCVVKTENVYPLSGFAVSWTL
jgi:ATP adenylyltransferase/5',5'''-P-1,P-4-tetraphosphate phosphorylase II